MNGITFATFFPKPYILFLIFLLSHIPYFLNLHKKNFNISEPVYLTDALFESHEPRFTNEPLHFASVQGPSAGPLFKILFFRPTRETGVSLVSLIDVLAKFQDNGICNKVHLDLSFLFLPQVSFYESRSL